MRAILLLPLTALYYLINRIWNIYWRIKRPIKLDVTVISVGNITLGGSGKTTLAGYIAQKLLLQNKKVAIVARGYKRPGGGLTVIKHGDEIEWEKCGDEPAALAQSISGITVYVDSDKSLAASQAAKDGFKYLVIDDGFQHRNLRRDIDIVCLDRQRPFGNGLLLPSGTLREPWSALKRADILVRMGNNNEPCDIAWKLPAELPVYDAHKIASALTPLRADMPRAGSRRVLAFCGLGNPNSFRRSISEIGCEIVDFVEFADHHIYAQAELEKLIDRGKARDIKTYITTLKDAVKLGRLWPSELPLYYLQITIKLESEDDFFRLLNI